MNIGSGKVTKAEQKLASHWMLDVISPRSQFSVAQFKKKADKIIFDILKRGKLPIICGGTGFWIQAVVDDINFPKVKPDWQLREKLGKLNTEKLFAQLEKLDQTRAKNIDAKNKVRLIRAIEIAKALGSVPIAKPKEENSKYDFLQIGLDIPKEELHSRIEKRLAKRFRQGMLAEVSRLHFEDKISWKKLESFGLEYRWLARYLQGKISRTEMQENLFHDSKDYAKRQMTWFRKDERIKWLADTKEIEKETKIFLAK
jgi:tRNA dimethylallyltransferase